MDVKAEVKTDVYCPVLEDITIEDDVLLHAVNRIEAE